MIYTIRPLIYNVFTLLLASVLVLGLTLAPIVEANTGDSKESQDKKDKHTSNLFQTESFLPDMFQTKIV